MPTEADVQFGEIAVKNKLITKKQHDEAVDALKKLESELKKRGQLGKKRPRLVDVLVQKKVISGSQAKSVENARLYRQVRLDDKLYGRIALKSKFCSDKALRKALERQQKDYLKGKKPARVSKYLLDDEALTDEQHDAIMEVIAKLDAEEYFTRTKKKKGAKAPSSDDDDDDDDADESEVDEGDLEELDEDDLELDLDADDDDDDDDDGKKKGGGKAKALDDERSARAIDSAIDAKLSSIDDEIEEASGSRKTKPAAKKPAKGGSSDELEVEDSTDDDDLDGLDLDDDDDVPSKPAAKKGAAAKKDESSDDLDLDDLDLDEDSSPKGKKAPAKKKASDDDLDDLDDLDLDDDEDSSPKGKKPAAKKASDDDDLDDLDDLDLDDDEDSSPKGKKPAPKPAGKKPAPAAKKKVDDDDDLDDLDLDLDDD